MYAAIRRFITSGDMDEADRNRFFSREFIDVGLAGLDVELVDEWRGEVQVSAASESVLERLHAAAEARRRAQA